MKYTENNINGVTFRIQDSSTIFIIDPYKRDTRGLAVVDGWSIPSILQALNSGDWVEVIHDHDKWVDKKLDIEYEIY